MTESIETMMQRLRLGGMARRWEEIAVENPEQYLSQLLQLELRERDVNRINKLTISAAFPAMKILDEFDRHAGITLPAGLNRQNLETLEFRRVHDNVIFMGSIGTGKPHPAAGLGLQARQKGYTVRFFTAAGLANTLLEKQDRRQLAAYMNTLQKADLIILDEVGYIPLHKTSAQLLIQVIAECGERRSMIVTSNLEFSRWNTVLGDTQLTGALVDRLIHHAHIALFSWNSYRLAQSMARRRQGTMMRQSKCTREHSQQSMYSPAQQMTVSSAMGSRSPPRSRHPTAAEQRCHGRSVPFR